MPQLRLPRLVGTREAVTDLLAEQQVPASLRDEPLVVLCRVVASGSTSFADELVRQVVEVRDARELVLVGAPERLLRYVRDAAGRRGVSSRVVARSGAEVEV